MNKYQFVNWFPEWKGFHFRLVRHNNLALIYDWCFFFGFWEIRKWSKRVSNLTKQEG